MSATSNLIEVLETLGSDSGLRYATQADLDRALSSVQLNSALRAAVLSGDQRRLEEILGVSTNVCCMIHAPKTDEDEEEKRRKAKEHDREKAA